MLPWSVIPIADISSRCASASIGPTFAAPSNIEYSVWLCRCTNDWLIGTPVYGRAPTHPRRVGKCVLRDCALAKIDGPATSRAKRDDACIGVVSHVGLLRVPARTRMIHGAVRTCGR